MIEQIAARLPLLPPNVVKALYEIALFMPTQSEAAIDVTEEELAAEDALWAATTAQHADKLGKLNAQITAEIEAGTTKPMFDEKGNWLVDEQIAAEQV